MSGKNRTDIELLANIFFSNGVIVSGYSSLFGFHSLLHILTLFGLIQCNRGFRTCQCVLHNTDRHRINSSPVGKTECQLSLGCFYFYFCCSVSQNPNCRVTEVIPSLTALALFIVMHQPFEVFKKDPEMGVNTVIPDLCSSNWKSTNDIKIIGYTFMPLKWHKWVKEPLTTVFQAH